MTDHSGKSPEFIDFSYPISTERLMLDAKLSHRGIHVVSGSLSPLRGGLIGGRQLAIVVHQGDPFEMEWQMPGSDRLQRKRVEFRDVYINPGDNPFFMRWQASPKIIGMALDRDLLDRVGNETFGRDSSSLQTRVAITDERLALTARTWREELAREGAAEKLFAEHLGIILAAHLFRHYSDGERRFGRVKGGLGNFRLRRVIEYIETHLADDLSIATLASVADRSLHHFSEAFRQSTGVPPHQFVLIRRIERAKVLLISTDMTITEIAFAVGYSSQSHFALKFRDLTGVTPQRFRLDRE